MKNNATYGTCISKPNDIKPCSLHNAMLAFRDGIYKEQIAAIRQCEDEKKQKALKQNLPYIVLAEIEGSRCNANVKSISGIILDYDHIQDRAQFREYASFIPYASYVFRSPIDGMKIVVMFEKPLTGTDGLARYKTIWEYVKKQCDAIVRHTSDSTPDPARACFVSYDPEMEIKEEVGRLDYDKFVVLPSASFQRRLESSSFQDDNDLSVVGQHSNAAQTQAQGDPTSHQARNVGQSPPADKQQATFRQDWNPTLQSSPISTKENRINAELQTQQNRINAELQTQNNRINAELQTSKYDMSSDLLIRKSVDYLSQRSIDYSDWIKVGMALKSCFGSVGKSMWDLFSGNPNYSDSPEKMNKIWKGFPEHTALTKGTIVYIAGKYGLEKSVDTRGSFTSQPQDRHSREGGNPGSATVGAADGKELDASLRWHDGEKSGDSRLRGNDSHEYETQSLLFDEQDCLNENRLDGYVARNMKENMQLKNVSLNELINLFGKPVEIMIDKSKLHPEFVKYLDITSDITDARDGSKLTAWLPIIAANIGNRVHIVNNSSRIFCSIWAMIIGPSSISRKTTVIKLAQQTLDRFEDRLSEDSPDDYIKNTTIMTDVSFTKMLSMLAANPNRVFIQMEISAWMRLMNKNWNSGMKQSLTDLYDGVDKTIANMDRCERIRRPAFSICSATTEGWLLSEMKDIADQQSGFLHRFLYCVIKNIDANDVDISYREGSYNMDILHEYDELYSLLRCIPDNTRLRLSPEAITVRNTEYAKVFKSAVAMKNDTLIGYFTRIYDGYFFKFCIIIHIFEHLEELRRLEENDGLVGQSPSADKTRAGHVEQHADAAQTRVGHVEQHADAAQTRAQSDQLVVLPSASFQRRLESSSFQNNTGLTFKQVRRPALPSNPIFTGENRINAELQTQATFRQDWNPTLQSNLPALLGNYLKNHQISPETVRQALYLCDYYFQNTIPFLSSLNDSTKLQNERKLIELIIREPNGTISHSALLNRSHFNKKEFKEAIESLIERGALWVSPNVTHNGRYVSRVYVCNEALLISWSSEMVA